MEGRGLGFTELVLDRGNTYLRPETLHWPMAQAGVRIHMDLHTNQRGQDVTDLAEFGIVKIDGDFYDRRMPLFLWHLEPHDPNNTDRERDRKADLYALRELWRWEPHGRPDADCYQRLISPWYLGKL